MATSTGQTLAQKILARAAGRARVEPGEYLTVTPDYTACQEIAWPIRRKYMDDVGVDKVARPDKLVMVVDHTTFAAKGSSYHRTHGEMAAYAAKNGVENFFGAGTGLRHLVLVERGFARPGLVVFSDEANVSSIGAVGALNVPVSWEVAVTTIGDSNWTQVPESARIHLSGRLARGVQVRDLVQAINRDHTTSGDLAQCCIEYAGPGIAALSLDDRQALCAAAYHTGADTALMPLDEVAIAFVQARAAGRPWYRDASDADAAYCFEAGYDLSALEPFVTLPPSMERVVPVRDAAGLRIDQAAIGSCAANRLDDLRAAAEVLRGRKIARHVTMYITPGSREVHAAAAREGLLEVFMDAGATVLAPGCSTCWGYEGALADKEVSITTHQHNYAGRNGSTSALVHLASPYVVAASAVAGEIADPRPMLAGN